MNTPQNKQDEEMPINPWKDGLDDPQLYTKEPYKFEEKKDE